jgi:hypothetical protein
MIPEKSKLKNQAPGSGTSVKIRHLATLGPLAKKKAETTLKI